jgi:hypothetical protein
VIARTTVQKLSKYEQLSPIVREEIENFDKLIAEHLSQNIPEIQDLFVNTKDIYEHDCDEPFEQESSMPEQDKYPDVDTYDQYLTAQVLLPRVDTYEKGTILRRKRNNDGMLVGRANPNPILDTRVFEVVFPDGHIAEYATNVIAEICLPWSTKKGMKLQSLKAL